MTWGAPLWLHLLWLAPLVGLLMRLALRRRQRALEQLGGLVSERISAGARRVHARRMALLFAGLLLGVIALAQPRWGYRWQEIPRRGLDIVVVLDVSRSMDATDLSPSRMERARREVQDLAEMMGGDRVGLVLFAGGAFPRMPLTLDYAALRMLVEDSGSQSLSRQGSDLGAAIDEAVGLLGPQGAADRAILLISDGEDHGGRAVEAAQAARAAGITVFAMGVGTADGAPIPLEGGGFQKDEAGGVVISRLDEGLLTEVARAGEGAYIRSVASQADLEALYGGEIRGKLQSAELGTRRDRIWDERYQWPLLGAVLALAGMGLFRPGPLRLGAVGGLLLGTLLVGQVRAQDWKAEAARLAAEQAKRPHDVDLAEQLGEALYKAGEYAAAEQVLEGVARRSTEAEQRARARYNGGLAAYRGGRLAEAVEDWKEVLAEAPEHPGARQNLQAVEQEIARRLEPPPPSQADPQQGDGQQDSGQPQVGQPQVGQPQEGQPQEGQPQEGQPQEGQPQEGQPQEGQPQEGQPQGEGEQAPGGPAGEGQIEEAAGQPEQGADTGSDQVAGSSRPGELTEEGAHRLLDSVEEGQPTVGDPRRPPGGKEW